MSAKVVLRNREVAGRAQDGAGSEWRSAQSDEVAAGVRKWTSFDDALGARVIDAFGGCLLAAVLLVNSISRG